MTKISTILQLIRDIILIGFSLVVMPSVYGRWYEEPVFLVIFGMGGLFLFLSTAELILLARKTKGKKYFYFNCAIQLFPTFIIAGLFPFLGIPLLILTIAVLVALRKR